MMQLEVCACTCHELRDWDDQLKFSVILNQKSRTWKVPKIPKLENEFYIFSLRLKICIWKFPRFQNEIRTTHVIKGLAAIPSPLWGGMSVKTAGPLTYCWIIFFHKTEKENKDISDP